ncbi:MAG: ABC-type transport auxiliary lipoprotein family protein [Burkholderiales bacterium]|nr:ABC-type transport auxiliary lipoprotein family protein [Burkholderiales bacterium]
MKTPIVLGLLCLLTACSSVPVTRYYRLADVPLPPTPLVSVDRPVVLLDIKLADFLSGGGIAYQQGEVGLTLAQQNLWAERVQEGVKRVLVARMQQYQPSQLWLGSAPDARINTLTIELSQFNGRDDGKALLGGRWTLRNAEQKLLMQSPFYLEVAQQGAGYDALVLALGEGLDRLSQNISQDFHL